jgi:pimeloyl-ACP methyl ester carboxylesterase
MPSFHHGAVEIAYLDQGEGEPIVLIHGFASTKEVNWVAPGWMATLARDERRVIALDNRGHGASSKLYDPADYHTRLMASDALAFLAHDHPQRVRSTILGGLGIHLVDGVGLPESIADALEAPSADDVTDPTGSTFRRFAEQTKSDRRALAACIRGSRQTMSRAEVAELSVPMLIAVGTKDPVAGSAQDLAALIPGARALDIPDRDHMLAVGDKVFKAGALNFLKARP